MAHSSSKDAIQLQRYDVFEEYVSFPWLQQTPEIIQLLKGKGLIYGPPSVLQCPVINNRSWYGTSDLAKPCTVWLESKEWGTGIPQSHWGNASMTLNLLLSATSWRFHHLLWCQFSGHTWELREYLIFSTTAGSVLYRLVLSVKLNKLV